MTRCAFLSGSVLVAAAAVGVFAVGLPSTSRSIEHPHASGATDAAGLFEDVTAQAGIAFVNRTADGEMDDVLENVGTGAVVLDYDGDGRLDVFLVQSEAKRDERGTERPADGTGSRLYRNDGNLRFHDVTAEAGLEGFGGGYSGAAADYDGDGDVDLFVFRDGPNRLFRNLGGRFEEIGAEAGIAGEACSVAGTLLDYDGDGWLDLYVGNYLTFDAGYSLHYQPDAFPGPLAFTAERDALYRNRGDGTFADVTDAVGLASDAGRAMGVLAGDFDDDGRAEVFVANDGSANHFYDNVGGALNEVALTAGVAYGFYGEATGAMAGVAGDFDLDGRPDIFVTDTRYGSLYRNTGEGYFRDRCHGAGVAAPSASCASWGGGFVDVDNDGDLDLLVANGDLHYATGRADLLLENDGAGRFSDASARGGPYFRLALPSRAACLADFDDDGGTDALLTMIEGPVVLLRGRPPRAHHWIGIALTDTAGRRSHSARVTVRAGGRAWIQHTSVPSGYLAQNDPRLHFGLGAADTVDAVEVRWPSGREERFRGRAVDRVHELVEGRGTP